MANVEFKNNSVKVKEAINDAIIGWLYEVGGEVQSQFLALFKVSEPI